MKIETLEDLVERGGLGQSTTATLECVRLDRRFNDFRFRLLQPDTYELFCEACERERAFAVDKYSLLSWAHDESGFTRLTVMECARCRNVSQVGIVAEFPEVNLDLAQDVSAEITKVMHWPANLVVDSDMRSLFRGSWEFYRKGLSSERVGSGIGAAAYYRRIIETEIGALLDEMRAFDQNGEFKEALDKVESGRRGAEKIDAVSEVLPASLFINGENPLKLLYASLSVDIHKSSDKEALETAQETRVLLEFLTRQIRTHRRTQEETKKALKKLRKKQ